MNTSTEIKNIAAALVGFHKEVGIIKKDAKNPFFKSKYASLSQILETIDEPLTNNGLAIVQFPEGQYGLCTRLVHTSGEWLEACYTMKPTKDTPQDLGSAITYQRRYAVGAILSLNIDDDDDGNNASGRGDSAGNSNGQPKSKQRDTAPQNEPQPDIMNRNQEEMIKRMLKADAVPPKLRSAIEKKMGEFTQERAEKAIAELHQYQDFSAPQGNYNEMYADLKDGK